MFDFSFLNPSKRKAMWYGLLWGGITILFLMWQWVPCMFSALLIACFYGATWFYKFNRDQRAIEAAEVKHMALSYSQHNELPPPMATPPMTSKGSSRLFVPPPLTDR